MPDSPNLKTGNIEVVSTLIDDLNLKSLHKSLEMQRTIWINAYLVKDFRTIESVLSPDFRCINGKEISDKTQWHESLKQLWQLPRWATKPLLPHRTRYHFFTATECMITLYFKDEKLANVMQELWMKEGDTWRFSALSTVNR